MKLAIWDLMGHAKLLFIFLIASNAYEMFDEMPY